VSYKFTLYVPRDENQTFHVDLINWLIPNAGPLSGYNMNNGFYAGKDWNLRSSVIWMGTIEEYELELNDDQSALLFKLTWSNYIVS
jgi:hypothetical protein